MGAPPLSSQITRWYSICMRSRVQIPYILITTNPHLLDLKEVLTRPCQAVYVIVKPMRLTEVVDAVRSALER